MGSKSQERKREEREEKKRKRGGGECPAGFDGMENKIIFCDYKVKL